MTAREWHCLALTCEGWTGAGREAALDHERMAHEGAAVCMPDDPELDAYSAARKAGATREQAQAAADPYRSDAERLAGIDVSRHARGAGVDPGPSAARCGFGDVGRVIKIVIEGQPPTPQVATVVGASSPGGRLCSLPAQRLALSPALEDLVEDDDYVDACQDLEHCSMGRHDTECPAYDSAEPF